MYQEEMIVKPEKVTLNKSIYFIIKRMFDIVVSMIGIIFLIPIAIIVKIVSILQGDFQTIFFKQKRLGRKGEYIYIYKFRTMVSNAEEVLEKWLKENEEIRKEYYETRKIEKDPRITRIGRILRETSLDEFPQFINILKGEMSFIGPRPIVPDEIENYKEEEREQFLSMRPGLTGYWASNGRSNTSYEERVEMELYYVSKCSIWLDIKIMFATIWSVLKRDGAK